MSLYELVFIVRQENSSVRAKELAKKVAELVTSKGGKIKKEEYWGFKNLAYQIKKNKKGHYLFFVFDASVQAISELRNEIRLTQDIVRHMFVKIKEKDFDNKPSEMMKEDENGE